MEKSTALITGASGGIGYELAKVMAKNGINLVLVARSLGKLEELKQELEKEFGISVLCLPADLSDTAQCQKLFTEIQNRKMHIDFLVNNAGFGDFGKFAESEWGKTHQMVELNITSLTFLTRLFLPGMLQRKKGKILNVASTAAFQAGPLMAVYYATKAYVLSFSEAIANELEGTGVTVTALCPGPTQSGFTKAAGMEESGLFKGTRFPTSKDVAEYGYCAMMKGKTLAIHGKLNKVLAFSTRLAPRKVLARAVRRLQDVATKN